MRQNAQAEKLEARPSMMAKRAGAMRGRAEGPTPDPLPVVRVAVALHRARLGIDEPGGYFRLKMLLVRTLRRGFKTSILEVDDAEEAPGSAAEVFTVTIEPDDPQAHARAVRTVRRVLRSRR